MLDAALKICTFASALLYAGINQKIPNQSVSTSFMVETRAGDKLS